MYCLDQIFAETLGTNLIVHALLRSFTNLHQLEEQHELLFCYPLWFERPLSC